MKTTIDIADPLLAQAKQLASRRRTTLKALIESALREELARARAMPPAAPVRTHTFAGRGLQAGLSWDDWGAIRRMGYEGRGG